MQQLTSTKIDAFSSAGFMYSNASAAPRAELRSGGHGLERHASGFSATFSSTAGVSTIAGERGERLANSAAVNSMSMLTGRNGKSTSSSFPACGKSDKSADASAKDAMSSIGSAIIGGVSKCNDLLNTPLVSSVGQIFNKFGLCGKLCHLAPDLGGYAVSRMVAGVGKALGGTGSPDYHFEHEWLRGGSSSKQT